MTYWRELVGLLLLLLSIRCGSTISAHAVRCCRSFGSTVSISNTSNWCRCWNWFWFWDGVWSWIRCRVWVRCWCRCWIWWGIWCGIWVWCWCRCRVGWWWVWLGRWWVWLGRWWRWWLKEKNKNKLVPGTHHIQQTVITKDDGFLKSGLLRSIFSISMPNGMFFWN